MLIQHKIVLHIEEKLLQKKGICLELYCSEKEATPGSLWAPAVTSAAYFGTSDLFLAAQSSGRREPRAPGAEASERDPDTCAKTSGVFVPPGAVVREMH